MARIEFDYLIDMMRQTNEEYAEAELVTLDDRRDDLSFNMLEVERQGSYRDRRFGGSSYTAATAKLFLMLWKTDRSTPHPVREFYRFDLKLIKKQSLWGQHQYGCKSDF